MANTATAPAKKAGARELALGTFQGLILDPKDIVIESGFNARDFTSPENINHVRILADSIKAMGQKVPVTVRRKDDKFVLVDGESRYRGIQIALKEGAEIKGVKAILEDKSVSEPERIASLLTHNTGKRLNQMEQAAVFARLKKFGWTALEIASKTGITTTHVNNILSLHAAPEEIKNAVKTGDISASTAQKAIREYGDNAPEVIKKAVKEAKAAGKNGTVKPKDLPESPRKKVKRDPLSISKSQGKQLIAAMAEVYFTKDIERRQYLGIFRNVFEDILGNKWKEIITNLDAEMNQAE